MRRILVLPGLLLLLLVACQDSGPSMLDSADPEEALILFDANAENGASTFSFLPPLVSASSPAGPFDPDRSPTIVICQPDGAGDCSELDSFDARSQGQEYRVNWRPRDSGLDLGTEYAIQVWLGEQLLGSLAVTFVQNAPAGQGLDGLVLVGLNGMVPIRFHIGEGAVLAALQEECELDGTVVDCDVQEGDPDEETEAIVNDDPENPTRRAGLVRFPENALQQRYIVILKHLDVNFIAGAVNPGAGPPIPQDRQRPFFLDVKVYDLDGNRIEDLDLDAYLALCQPADVPPGLMNIFRFSEGETEIMDTNQITTECHVQVSSAPGSVLQRGMRGLAGLFRAQPLHAVHGGLNTITNRFSEFGAVVPDEAHIASPQADEVVTESPLELLAFDPTAPNNTAQWAVRDAPGNPECMAGEGNQFNRAGNVDGMTHAYQWTEGEFSASVDISNFGDGDYCFVLNTLSGPAAGHRMIQFFSIEL